jgi:hypothetical protein
MDSGRSKVGRKLAAAIVALYCIGLQASEPVHRERVVAVEDGAGFTALDETARKRIRLRCKDGEGAQESVAAQCEARDDGSGIAVAMIDERRTRAKTWIPAFRRNDPGPGFPLARE